MHHHILNHREMYGLPRKFNIAFDGGGAISALEDTNDIGFTAVRVGEGKVVPAGVYFRLQLGGISGHKDFAKDEGVLLTPDQCVPVADAVVRVFNENGDRTDRKKARLKYVLDRWGHEKYVAETEKLLPFKLTRFPLAECDPRPAVAKHGHLGVHPQKQPGLFYVGVLLPVGRLTTEQMRGLADLADQFGSGTIRLTVWQNLLISDIAGEDIPAVKGGIEALGLHWEATNVRGGARRLHRERRVQVRRREHQEARAGDRRLPRAAADTRPPAQHPRHRVPELVRQHYLGDIGLLGTGVEVGDDVVEGYHVFVGGGYGEEQHIGREMFRGVAATDAPARDRADAARRTSTTATRPTIRSPTSFRRTPPTR